MIIIVSLQKTFNYLYPGIKNVFQIFLIMQKKRSLNERSFKINLIEVFPCFHSNKLIPPTHNITITLIS